MKKQVLRILLLAFYWTIGTAITNAQENFCLENGVTADFIKNVVYPNDDYSYTKIKEYYTQTTDYRKDLPLPVRLSVPNTNEGKSLILETYCYGELVRSDKYAVGQTLLEIWNLIPQTSYTYKLYILYSDNTKKEVASGRFRTEGQVRMMNIDKVRNFRDLGGWALPNNQRIKYDKIFRSAELATTTSQAITEAGIHEMINVQKIQVEIDFSSQYSDSSPVSDYLEHVHGTNYEIKQCVDGLKNYRTQYKNCFEKTVNSLRAGKKVFFHCLYGADRTGTFAFLLEGLLGVSESDLAKEYELTNFYHTARHRTANTNGYKETIDYIKSTFAGNTINEKIEKMALSFGISQKDIDDFRSLMTESNIPSYALTYYVDGTEYKTYKQQKGKAITPETAPTKEGYTFSGWSDIPQTMPANDVEVTGSFTINNYKLIYKVDGKEYKTLEIEYGANITPEEAPTMDNYTFSGWSEIPDVMPSNDVEVTGTFTIKKYKLIYKLDGEEYKTIELEYEATITPEEAPIKEGYTFSGWSEIPEKMPAEDLIITGTYEKIPDGDDITIGDTGKAWYCSKHDLDFTNVEGLKAYTATAYDSKKNLLWLSRAYEISSGTGIMLKGEVGRKFHVPYTESLTYYANMFTGDANNDMMVSKIDGDYMNFYLNKEGQIVPFGNETVTYPAGMCYLQIPIWLLEKSANTRSVEYAFDDENETATGIYANTEQEFDVFYNLQGQRVDNPTKGLYIKNGHKVVIK